MTAPWPTTPLGELCDILDSLRKPITKRNRTSGVFPYYGATGIVDYVDGYIFDEKLVLVGEDGAKWGAGERTAFVVEGKCWVNNHAHVLRPLPERVLPEWLAYYLTYSDLTPFVGGLTVPKLNQGNLRTIPIPAPPLKVQAEIIGRLEAWFATTDSLIKNAESSYLAARALPHSLLDEVVNADSGWSSTTLGEIAEFKNGLNFTRSSRGESVKIVGVKDFQDDYWIPEDGLDSVTIDGELPAGYELRRGDILTVRSNGNPNLIGRCIIAGDVGEKTSHSGFTIRIRVTEKRILPEFLTYLLKTQTTRARLVASGGGANITSLNQQALASLPVAFPDIATQKRLLSRVQTMTDRAQRLIGNYERKLAALSELRQAMLHSAFNSGSPSANIRAITATVTPEFTARVLAFAYNRHVNQQRSQTFGHVKAQKTLHVVETIGKVDLGRAPIKDAAGPNDFPHMLKAEKWAKENQFFEFVKRNGGGYDFKKLAQFDKLHAASFALFQPHRAGLEKAVDLVIPLDSEAAEIFATVHAAWNNLLVDGKQITDAAILREAREDWHQDKLAIPEHKFKEAIKDIRRKGLEPDGTGKPVRGQESLF